MFWAILHLGLKLGIKLNPGYQTALEVMCSRYSRYLQGISIMTERGCRIEVRSGSGAVLRNIALSPTVRLLGLNRVVRLI